MPMPANDISGMRFRRLRVIDKSPQRSGGHVMWCCNCDCGNSTVVSGQKLRCGRIVSCGCHRLETHTKHGASTRNNMHPLYSIWKSMKQRCFDKNAENYPDYGGRGIVVCDEWKNSYESFRDYLLALPHCPDNAEIVGSSLNRQIDRIENDDIYRPGNVQWSTVSEQSINKRNTRYVTVNGERIAFKTAVDKYGKAPYNVILNRITQHGWSLRRAFLTPNN